MIKVGTAGIPGSTPKSGTAAGIEEVAKLGLRAMEIEFVRGVYMKQEQAREVAKVAKRNKIALTVHAPYYINLNSSDKIKKNASMARILQSAKIGALAGAESVTFHPAYYTNKKPEEVYQIVKEALLKIIDELKRSKINIRLSPETTGKHSAFGNIDEILSLSAQIKEVHPCIDFAHLHARLNGGLKTKKHFDQIFEKIEGVLGKKELKNMHMHVSGIAYNEKGERHHLMLKESDFNIKALVSSIKSYQIRGVLICESPDPQADALYVQSLF